MTGRCTIYRDQRNVQEGVSRGKRKERPRAGTQGVTATFSALTHKVYKSLSFF